MHSIDWHSVLTWAVLIAAPVVGGLLWIRAYGGPKGEQRNRMWTQGPFVPTGEEEPQDKSGK
ncbi:MAG: hypothetical protein JWR21_3223 [Herminiimonas sp.]|nr:hypothetical protein [Herminiimonas sp.]